MKVTTTTGVVLDTEGGWAKDITIKARAKGFQWIAVTAEHPDKTRTYLLLDEKNEPLFEHTSFEEMCCFVERNNLIKLFNEREAL